MGRWEVGRWKLERVGWVSGEGWEVGKGGAVGRVGKWEGWEMGKGGAVGRVGKWEGGEVEKGGGVPISHKPSYMQCTYQLPAREPSGWNATLKTDLE